MTTARRRLRNTGVALAVIVGCFSAGLVVAENGAPRPLLAAEAVVGPDRPEWAPQEARDLRLFELGDLDVWVVEANGEQCLSLVDRGVRTLARCADGHGELHSGDHVFDDGVLRGLAGEIRADLADGVEEGAIIRLVVSGDRLEMWEAAPPDNPGPLSAVSFHSSDRPGVG
ncbi:hypothetical protein [Microbacterium sp. NPDC055683]